MEVKGREKATWAGQIAPEGKALYEWTEARQGGNGNSRWLRIAARNVENGGFVSKLLNIDPHPEFGKHYGEPGNPNYEYDSRGVQWVFDLLVCTGLAEAFAKRFPDNTGVFDNDVVQALAIKLPGRRCVVDVYHKTDKDGTVRAEIKGIEAAKGGNRSAGREATTAAASAATQGTEDWDDDDNVPF